MVRYPNSSFLKMRLIGTSSRVTFLNSPKMRVMSSMCSGLNSLRLLPKLFRIFWKNPLASTSCTLPLLSDVFLADLPGFLNFAFDTRSPAAVWLVGLPRLAQRLRMQVHAPLATRIAAQVHLSPLERDDFKALVEHGISAAGSREKLLTDSAIELLFRVSRGIPRIASRLLRAGLKQAHGEESERGRRCRPQGRCRDPHCPRRGEVVRQLRLRLPTPPLLERATELAPLAILETALSASEAAILASYAGLYNGAFGNLLLEKWGTGEGHDFGQKKGHQAPGQHPVLA